MKEDGQIKGLQWGSSFSEIGGGAIRFTSGSDAQFDFLLFESEITACKAHAKMLLKQGIIAQGEADGIFAGLGELEALDEGEKQAKVAASEDVHSAVLSFLEEKHGVKNLHCGRSRNDLVACDEKLFLKKQAQEMQVALGSLVKALAKKALEHANSPMPGYTHHQPALPTTFGHTLLAFAYAFKRDSQKFANFIQLHDSNPLGAGVGFGTTLPIDAKQTTLELGFSKTQENSLDAVSSRWEPQADFAYACASAMTHLSILAQTLLIFSMKETGFATLEDVHSTGSSAMPQKKNPDVLEAIKAKAAKTQASLLQVLSAAKSNLAGYNKDLQWGKYCVMESAFETKTAVETAAQVIDFLGVNAQKMEKAAEGNFIGALSVAEQLKQEHGIDFSSAKKIVEKAVAQSAEKGLGKIGAGILNKLLAEAEVSVTSEEMEEWQDAKWIVSKTGESGPNPAHVLKKAGELLAAKKQE